MCSHRTASCPGRGWPARCPGHGERGQLAIERSALQGPVGAHEPAHLALERIGHPSRSAPRSMLYVLCLARRYNCYNCYKLSVLTMWRGVQYDGRQRPRRICAVAQPSPLPTPTHQNVHPCVKPHFLLRRLPGVGGAKHTAGGRTRGESAQSSDTTRQRRCGPARFRPAARLALLTEKAAANEGVGVHRHARLRLGRSAGRLARGRRTALERRAASRASCPSVRVACLP
jgi:hypothetical protein